jgi:hypothetical protein
MIHHVLGAAAADEDPSAPSVHSLVQEDDSLRSEGPALIAVSCLEAALTEKLVVERGRKLPPFDATG